MFTDKCLQTWVTLINFVSKSDPLFSGKIIGVIILKSYKQLWIL